MRNIVTAGFAAGALAFAAPSAVAQIDYRVWTTGVPLRPKTPIRSSGSGSSCLRRIGSRRNAAGPTFMWSPPSSSMGSCPTLKWA